MKTNKEFNKIHKLYKDISEIYFEYGFLNVVISMPLKNRHIFQSHLHKDLEKIYKLNLKFFTATIFKDAIYFIYEVKE